MGLDVTMFKTLIVKTTLDKMGLNLNTAAAVNLLTGTAIKESSLQYLKQIGTGPALGLFEVEPVTEQDQWNTFLNLIVNHSYFLAVEQFVLPGMTTTDQLPGNLYYECAIARIKYWRAPAALPAATDATGLANYWKTVYNSDLGAGVVDAATVACFQTAINS